MFSFVITHVFKGSEKQVNAGIHATFNLDIVDDKEGVIVTMRDLKLNKAKDGNYYIGSPYRAYTTKNDQGQDEEKKVHFIKIWPDQKNWGKQEEIIRAVQTKLSEGGTAKGSYSKPRTESAPAPVAAAKKAPVTDAW